MTERQYLNRKETPNKAAPESSTPDIQPDANEIVELQRYLGNQGVQRLLAQRRLKPNGQGLRIQAKLEVGPAGDQYEREADSVAQQVMKMPDPIQRAGEDDELKMQRVQRAGEDDELKMQRVQRAGEDDELKMQRIQRAGEDDELKMQRVQRAGGEDESAAMEDEELKMKRIQRAGEDDELKMQRIQRKGTDDGFEVGGDIESTIQTERGRGNTLPDNTRGFMESRFGQDFSGVKVHNDTQSHALNESLSARAFTIGSDIFFRENEYKPDSNDGRELLAHELTHVVQQGGSVQKQTEDK